MDYIRQMNEDALVISEENGDVILSIREKALEDNGMLFELTGELKNEIAYEFEDELDAVLTVRHNIRIDLSGVTFIASAGLHTLLRAQQFVDGTSDGSLIISGISGEVAEIFENNGFTELFRFELPEEVTAL